MAKRATKRLTSRGVDTAQPGKYSDGNKLYLEVSPTGSRKWVFRYTRNGKTREKGLGAATGANLAKARADAMACLVKLAEGIDPIDDKSRSVGVPTFAVFAEEVWRAQSTNFKNAKHRAQWIKTLETYAAPLAKLRVNAVETSHVLACLKPIWTTKPETASRVRGRLEKVLDAAAARGYRTGENPARGRGHLFHLLGDPGKLTRGHHAAMDYKEVPGFIAELRKRPGVAPLALEFAILTAARSGEVMGACWSEMDLDAKVWTIPGNRMKAGREHRVPLSGRALEIVQALAEAKRGQFVFPGTKIGRPLSVMSLTMVLRRMKIPVTVHGFRSSFRDWAGNKTPFPREIAEQALAHLIGDKAEQAYRRSDALERRRDLMEAWDRYLDNQPETNILPIKKQSQ